MEAAIFPQPAGDLMIRPASAAPTISTQTSHLTAPSQQPSDAEEQRTSSSLSREHQDYHHHNHHQQQLQVFHQPPDRPSSAQRINRKHQLQIITDLKRGTPGEPNPARAAQHSPEGALVARHKGQVYSEMFAYREPAGNVRERVARDSIITAEVKTNVIIHDEYAFLTSFSSFLSERYGRPESSIAITLQHSTCVLLGGSFDPAYILTLTALPELVSPTLNKRNTALVQRHMTEELAVPQDRGIVRFVPIADSCLATAGTTMQAAVEAEKVHRGAHAADAVVARQNRAGLPPANSSHGNNNSNSSPSWRAVWKHQSPAESRASAGSGTTAVGSGMGSGGLFGRKKESRRDLKEQERRALLKGKARETGSGMLDSIPNGHGRDRNLHSRQQSTAGSSMAPDSPREYEPELRTLSSLARSFHRRRGSGSSAGNPARISSRGVSKTDVNDLDDEAQKVAQARALMPKEEHMDEQADRVQQMNSTRRSFMQLFGSR